MSWTFLIYYTYTLSTWKNSRRSTFSSVQPSLQVIQTHDESLAAGFLIVWTVCCPMGCVCLSEQAGFVSSWVVTGICPFCHWAHTQPFNFCVVCNLITSTLAVSGVSWPKLVTCATHKNNLTGENWSYSISRLDSLGQPKSLWETFPLVKWDPYHPEMSLWSMKVDRILE